MAFQVSVTHRFLLTPFCQQQQGWHRGEGQVSERNEQEQRVAMGRGREAWGTMATRTLTVGQSAWKLWAERTREVSNTILFTAGNPPASGFATWPVRLFKLPGTCALPHQWRRCAEDWKPRVANVSLPVQLLAQFLNGRRSSSYFPVQTWYEFNAKLRNKANAIYSWEKEAADLKVEAAAATPRHTLFSSSSEPSICQILFYYLQQMSINTHLLLLLYYIVYIM